LAWQQMHGKKAKAGTLPEAPGQSLNAKTASS